MCADVTVENWADTYVRTMGHDYEKRDDPIKRDVWPPCVWTLIIPSLEP